MLIYDPRKYHGVGLLLHVTGSAAFSWKAVFPSLVCALVTALFCNYDPVQSWLATRIPDGVVVFGGLQFLISLCLVSRVRIAVIRFRNAHEAYGRFLFTLTRCAVLLSTSVDRSANLEKFPGELEEYKNRFMRWIRAVHVLALEEFRGFEEPQYRVGVLNYLEEVRLFNESKKASRVIRWLVRGYLHHHLPLTAATFGADSKLRNLLDEVFLTYNLTLLQTHQIYFFPFAQLATACVWIYAFWLPFAFAGLMPHSNALGPLVCFFSVWVMFAFAHTGTLLEWPFNGQENDLPMAYFITRFMQEMEEIESGVDAKLVSLRLSRLVVAHDDEEEDNDDQRYPFERAEVGETELGGTGELVLRALDELEQASCTRRQWRQTRHHDNISNTNNNDLPYIPQMRAQQDFKALY